MRFSQYVTRLLRVNDVLRGPSFGSTLFTMKLLRVACLLLVLITGCVEVEVHTKMDRSGSGVQTWHFQTTALLAGEIQKQLENDPFFKKGRKLLEEFKDGDFIMVLEYPFRKVNDLAFKGRDIHFDREGMFRVHCTYTEVWDKDFGNISGALAEKTGNMIPLTLKVSVEMPGHIVRTNAAETKDSTATWRFTVGDLAGSRVLLVQSVYWNWSLILPLTALILIAAGIGAVLIVRKRAINAPSPCPSCGAKTAPQAAFCAACGTKLK